MTMKHISDILDIQEGKFTSKMKKNMNKAKFMNHFISVPQTKAEQCWDLLEDQSLCIFDDLPSMLAKIVGSISSEMIHFHVMECN